MAGKRVFKNRGAKICIRSIYVCVYCQSEANKYCYHNHTITDMQTKCYVYMQATPIGKCELIIMDSNSIFPSASSCLLLLLHIKIKKRFYTKELVIEIL